MAGGRGGEKARGASRWVCTGDGPFCVPPWPPGDATRSSGAAWDGVGGTSRCAPPFPRVSMAAMKRVGGFTPGWAGSPPGGQVHPRVGISPQRVPARPRWGVSLPRGGGLIPDPLCRAEAAWPGQHRDVPLPSPVPPVPTKLGSGGRWEVNPGVPPLFPGHPRRVPQLRRRRWSLPRSGIPLPKESRRASDKEVGEKPEVCVGGVGGKHPSGYRPEMVPPIPGAETGAGRSGFGTKRTLQPFREIPMLRLCGRLRAYVTSSAVSSGARRICS